MKDKNLWEKGVDLIVDSLGYAIVRFAPVIAPIPSIAVILEASNYSLISCFTVVGIEIIGYAIGDKMVETVRRGVLKMDKAIIPLILYALVIEGLMLGYQVIPSWYDGSTVAEKVKASVAMLYPFFTLAGAGLYALHEYLKELAIDTQYDKDKARQKGEEERQQQKLVEEATNQLNLEIARQQKLAELETYKQKLNQDLEIEKQKAVADLRIKEDKAKAKVYSKNYSDDKMNTNMNMNKEEKTDKILQYYTSNPQAKQAAVAYSLGISQPTVNRILNKLESEKRIRRNGNGVEIL